MSAIERCRTAALGGHVARCADCAYTSIAYNSCRIRHFLIHVLPRGFHRIRHYGLFAKSSCADNIARARELLAVAKPDGQPAATAVDPSKPSCPCCGGRMIVIEVFERGATPRHRPTAPTNVIRIDTS